MEEEEGGGDGFNTTMFDPERAINISRWGIIVFVVLEFCLTVSRMGEPGANFPTTKYNLRDTQLKNRITLWVSKIFERSSNKGVCIRGSVSHNEWIAHKMYPYDNYA